MYTKYPRTFNLPISQSNSSDDVWWKDFANFEGREVVISEKMDGEATTVYPNGHTHARSIDSGPHISRDWIKNYAATFCYSIPEGQRVSGENLFAFHSIFYDNLPSYFLVYNIFEGDHCLGWDDVVEMCQLLGVETVPVLFRGLWDEEFARKLWPFKPSFDTYELIDPDKQTPAFPTDYQVCHPEGFVVRTVEGFAIDEFKTHCAKMVRPAHVKTSQQWMDRPVIKNRLKE